MNSTINSEPLVSIVTVVFNGAKTLEQTIQSVLKQTYPNIEYIIIDGSSTDGSIDIIKKYQDKIACWVSEPDKGIYDAMNKGIAKATGAWIGIINSDDWYENDAVQHVISASVKYPEVFVIHGLQRFINQNDSLLSVYGASSSNLPNTMFEHSTCFVKRDCYSTYGKFNDSYKIAADYDLMLRFFINNIQFYMIEKVISNFRLTGKSENINNFLLRWKEVLTIKYQNGIISKRKLNYQRILLMLRFIKKILTHRR